MSDVQITRRIKRTADERYADVFSELHLLPTAPRALVDAAYRTLSKQYHPDVNDADAVAQQRLNVAYQRIKETLEKRESVEQSTIISV